jgi:hypothetical protein
MRHSFFQAHAFRKNRHTTKKNTREEEDGGGRRIFNKRSGDERYPSKEWYE